MGLEVWNSDPGITQASQIGLLSENKRKYETPAGEFGCLITTKVMLRLRMDFWTWSFKGNCISLSLLFCPICPTMLTRGPGNKSHWGRKCYRCAQTGIWITLHLNNSSLGGPQTHRCGERGLHCRARHCPGCSWAILGPDFDPKLGSVLRNNWFLSLSHLKH